MTLLTMNRFTYFHSLAIATVIDELPETIRVDEEGKGLLRGVAADYALRHRLFQLLICALVRSGLLLRSRYVNCVSFSSSFTSVSLL